MAIDGHFGHSVQAELSQNGPKRFPIGNNLGIDTNMKSLGLSNQKLRI